MALGGAGEATRPRSGARWRRPPPPGPRPTTKVVRPVGARHRPHVALLGLEPEAGEVGPVDVAALDLALDRADGAWRRRRSGAVRASSMVRGKGSSGSGGRGTSGLGGERFVLGPAGEGPQQRREAVEVREDVGAVDGDRRAAARSARRTTVRARSSRAEVRSWPGTTNSVGRSKRPPMSAITCSSARDHVARTRASAPPRASSGSAASVATSAISTQRSRHDGGEDDVELGAAGHLGPGQRRWRPGPRRRRRPPRAAATTWAPGRRTGGRWCRRRPCRSRAWSSRAQTLPTSPGVDVGALLARAGARAAGPAANAVLIQRRESAGSITSSISKWLAALTRLAVLVHAVDHLLERALALGGVLDGLELLAVAEAHRALEAHAAELAGGPGHAEQRRLEAARRPWPGRRGRSPCAG